MIREHGIYVAVDYILFDPETSIEELKDNIISDLKIDYTNKNNDITYDFLEEYTKSTFDLTPIMRMEEKEEIVDVLRTYINILHRRHKFVSTGGIFRIN